MNKMKFIFLCSILLIGSVNSRSLTFKDPECTGNETFTSWGSYCEPSCRSPNSLYCMRMYFRGCQCKGGFLRNPQGECVKEEDCPYENPKDKCKSVDCDYGGKCFIHEGRPVCIPEGNHLCWGFPCFSGTSCEVINNRPQCLAKTCYDINCGTGRGCVMVKPLSYANKTDNTMKPTCISKNDCYGIFGDVTHCPEESTCVLHEAECSKPPCNPIAKCEPREAPVPEGKQCRNNEIFSTCKKSCSDTKCNEKPDVCTEECDGSGCVCQEGLFRDRFGDCVTQIDCDAQKQYIKRFLGESD